jgi:hypothetical protein
VTFSELASISATTSSVDHSHLSIPAGICICDPHHLDRRADHVGGAPDASSKPCETVLGHATGHVDIERDPAHDIERYMLNLVDTAVADRHKGGALLASSRIIRVCRLPGYTIQGSRLSSVRA